MQISLYQCFLTVMCISGLEPSVYFCVSVVPLPSAPSFVVCLVFHWLFFTPFHVLPVLDFIERFVCLLLILLCVRDTVCLQLDAWQAAYDEFWSCELRLKKGHLGVL